MIGLTRGGWILTALVALGVAAAAVAVSAWILMWRDHRFRKRSRSAEPTTDGSSPAGPGFVESETST